MNRRFIHYLNPTLIFAITLCVYTFTLMPTVWWSDSAELPVKAYELGIPHPTGYPVYMLFAWAFTKLPIGDIAYRVNLLSAVFGALVSVVLYYTVLALTEKPWTGIVAALSFSFSLTEWSQSTIAEVYTLNSLLVCLCVLSLVLWQKGKARLELFAFLFGLSQAHHRTTVLLAIPFALFILLHHVAIVRQPRRIVRLFVAALLPQLFYVYLIVRGNWPSWQSLAEFVIRGGGQKWFRLPSALTEYAARLAHVIWPLLRINFGLVGFVLGMAGIALLLWTIGFPKGTSKRKWRHVGVLFLSSWLANTLFCSFYHVGDVDVFMLPSHIFIALGIGVASYVVVHTGLPRLTERAYVRYGLIATFAALPAALLLTHFEPLDRSQDFRFRDNSQTILTSVPPNAVIFSKWSVGWPLIYVQRIDRLRPDVEIRLAESGESIDIATPASANKPVYFLGLHPTALQLDRYGFQKVSALTFEETMFISELTLREPVYTVPEMQHPTQAHLDNDVTLLGYDLDRSQAGQRHLTLYWQPQSRVAESYTVFVHYVDSTGQLQAQHDGLPVDGKLTTDLWIPHEIIADEHTLVIPADLPAGEYEFKVGMYLLETGERVPVVQDGVQVAERSISLKPGNCSAYGEKW